MADLLRRVGPARLGALGVAAVGVVLLLLALAFATVWARPSTTTVRVTGQPGAPVVDTTAAALALDGPSVKVDVRGPDPAKTVFVGVGREGDVAAYLAGAGRTEVTGVDGDRAVTSRAGSETSLPEPTGVDVWALSASGPGRASLTWPQTAGHWRLVAAVDGATPPAEVTITWQRERGSSPVPALLAVGTLLLVLGAVGLRMLGRGTSAPAPARSRRARTDAPAPAERTGRHADRDVRRVEERDDDRIDDRDDEDEDADVEAPMTPAPFRAQPPGGGRLS
jgi:hypothetical protein